MIVIVLLGGRPANIVSEWRLDRYTATATDQLAGLRQDILLAMQKAVPTLPIKSYLMR
ncbi:hypothetical protein OURE66S_03146 [Oligella ureolytica]